MKLPISWLKDYVDFEDTIEGLADKLTFSGTEVEGIITLGGDCPGVVVGEVLENPACAQLARRISIRMPTGFPCVRSTMENRCLRWSAALQVNEVAAQLINTPDIDFSIFNEVAWDMMQDDRLLESGATAALMLAEKANALTEASDASVLDTLALARFRGGDVQGAIEAEEQAIALAPDVDELQMQLGLFKEALRDEQAADYMKNENTGSDQ